jgi:hypothetical protein
MGKSLFSYSSHCRNLHVVVQLTSSTYCEQKNKGNLNFVLISQVTVVSFPSLKPLPPPSFLPHFLVFYLSYRISPHNNQRYYCEKRWVVYSQLALTTRLKPVCIFPHS